MQTELISTSFTGYTPRQWNLIEVSNTLEVLYIISDDCKITSVAGLKLRWSRSRWWMET